MIIFCKHAVMLTSVQQLSTSAMLTHMACHALHKTPAFVARDHFAMLCLPVSFNLALTTLPSLFVRLAKVLAWLDFSDRCLK